MANRKISDLTALTAPVTGDLLPIVDISEAAAADKNKKITFGVFLASALSSVPLGTAAAPSIAFTGDLNTGFYSPAADTLAAVTAGSSRLHITSGGLVGIGSSSPQGLLDCSKAGKGGIVSLDSTAYAAGVGGTIDLGGNYRSTGDFQPFVRIAAEKTNSTDNNYDYNMGFYVTTHGGAPLGKKALTIDSTGNVGIGTPSPGSLLDVVGSNATDLSALRLRNTSATNTATTLSFYSYINFGGGLTARAAEISAETTTASDTGTSQMVFKTTSNITYLGPQENMRLDASGRLLVGTSSDSGGALLQVNGDRIRVGIAKTPSTSGATGTTGEIAWDANYIYVCTATNTWKRSAIATW